MATSVLTQEERQEHKELGRKGEDLACEYLEDQGLVVLSRNWRCRDGELDVVAVDPAATRLVVCEVKTRSATVWGRPDEALTEHQLSRLRRTTLRWLARHDVGWCRVRIDLIAVLWPPEGTPLLRHVRGT